MVEVYRDVAWHRGCVVGFEKFLKSSNLWFASVFTKELNKIELASKSDSTHKNTRWAAKLFKGKYKKIIVLISIQFSIETSFYYKSIFNVYF